MATLKDDWAMPVFEPVVCPDCGEAVRPIAVDVGAFDPETDLSVSCPEGCTWVMGIEWPFVEESVATDDLLALGFEIVD